MTDIASSQTPPATAEIRAFLIADIRDYTRFTLEQGDEAAARLAARFAAICRETAEGRGGEVLELRGDEALAVFSSSRAALRAAVELQARVAQEAAGNLSLPFEVRIGLDAGEAVAVEGGFRGTALNLAARLCTLAGPGEVLASETMTALARRIDGIDYRERGPVRLKGFDHPVRVVEIAPSCREDEEARDIDETPTPTGLPLGSYLGSLPEGPLIGRDAELKRGVAVIDAVPGGSGRMLLLAGEPGAGKTRLAQELTLELHNRAFLIAAGRCYEPQQLVPFYPIVDALTSLYSQLPADLQAAIPVRWPDLARLLPALGLAVPASSGPEDQQRLFWTVSAFLHAVAVQDPVALLFDDLHWADAASLDLLQHLARHTGSDRILIVGTFRDVEVHRRHPLEWALRDMEREGLIERTDIRRLDETKTHQLIAGLMGEEQVNDELAQLIYRRTEGNPFFVQQVLRVLVERGDLYRTDGGWDRRRIEEIEIPESVRSVVGQRLSRLAEMTQELLRQASVLGETFTFDDLQALSGATEAEVETALDQAVEAGLVRERGQDGYSFDHGLTRGSLYAELSSRRRRRLHLAAGEALGALPAHRRRGRDAELAWHFLEGDDPVRALRWSLAAGNAAEAVFAHRDAEGHYRTALGLAEEEDNAEQAQLAREKLGRTLWLLSDCDEALEVLDAAARAYHDAGNLEGEMRVLAEIAGILFDRGRRAEGIERAEPVLRVWEREGTPSRGACALLAALADLYWHAGRTDEALARASRAAEIATQLGDDRLLGHAQSRRGVFLSHLGRYDEALAAYNEALPRSEAADDLVTAIRTLNNRALLYGDLLRPREATADLDRAIELARRLGMPEQLGWQLVLGGMMAWWTHGDWKRARGLVDEIAPLEPAMKGTRSAFHLAMSRWIRFMIDHDLSMLSELERFAVEGEQAGDTTLWMAAQYWLAQWDLLEGRAEASAARCEAVLANAAVETQFRFGFESVLAWARIETGTLEPADALIAGQRALGRIGPPFLEVDRLTLLGRVHAARGQREEAERVFEQALAEARRASYLHGEGTVLYAWGEMLARYGDAAAARARFEAARQVAEQIHAAYYVYLVDRALAALPSS